MKFLKILSSVLFVSFGTGLASDCFASEFDENVELYNLATICMELSEMAGNDARVAGRMGINGCPMGRGITIDAAKADLKRRTETESQVIITFTE